MAGFNDISCIGIGKQVSLAVALRYAGNTVEKLVVMMGTIAVMVDMNVPHLNKSSLWCPSPANSLLRSLMIKDLNTAFEE